MATDQPLQLIKNALIAVGVDENREITESTHLVDDEIVDSLDLMSFLFELETYLDTKLDEIDESFTEFEVGKLVEIVKLAQQSSS